MKDLLSRQEARAFDQYAITRLGVPGIVLMENAARGAAEILLRDFARDLSRVVVVGGPGQNGGDGWAVARHLYCAGVNVSAVVVSESPITGDAKINLDILSAMDVEVLSYHGAAQELAKACMRQATLLIDALFGTGLSREVTGIYADAIALLNMSPVRTVALDLPSGVDADTGDVLGASPSAAATITFRATKRGLCQFPGLGHAGKVYEVSLGVPAPCSSEISRFDAGDAARWLWPRAQDTHKGMGGHALVIGGSAGRSGAAILSGTAALRAGAGLGTIASSAQRLIDAKVVELMTASLPSELGTSGTAELETLLTGKTACVVGPGLGLDAFSQALALWVIENAVVPTVIDADALTALASTEEGVSRLRRVEAIRVLTPHPGEAARLLDCSTAEVQADRYQAAKALAAACGHIVVLKGAGTIVAANEGHLLLVASDAHPALGVGGSGDVLAGVIAAVLGSRSMQASSPREMGFSQAVTLRVAAAVRWHFEAGTRAAVADRGMLAGEIAAALPSTLTELQQAARV